MIYNLDCQEMKDYLENLYNRLLEHRYRYYVLNEGAISDFEYDWIEREYNRLAAEHGANPMKMVDFDFKDPLALAAKERVDNETDNHSLWIKNMRLVWNKIGYSNKEKKKRE